MKKTIQRILAMILCIITVIGTIQPAYASDFGGAVTEIESGWEDFDIVSDWATPDDNYVSESTPEKTETTPPPTINSSNGSDAPNISLENQNTSNLPLGASGLEGWVELPASVSTTNKGRASGSLNISWKGGYSFGTINGIHYDDWAMYTINGENSYCLDFYNIQSTNGKTYISSTTNTVFDNLPDWKKIAITDASYFGYGSASGVNTHIATQIIIWELVHGGMDENFNRTNNAFYSCFAVNGSIQSEYANIISKMRSYSKVPSFSNMHKVKAPTHKMNINSGTYSVSLTDTNSVLANFDFSNTGGVTVSKSGNTLTLNSSSPITGAVEFETPNKLLSSTSNAVKTFWTSSDGTEQIKCSYNGIDPKKAYFKIYTDGTPPPKDEKFYITIIKRNSADNSLLPGATFTLTHSAHGNVGTFTMSTGREKIEVPWPGTYEISELSPPPNFVMPSDPDQTVYVDTDNPTAEVTFLNDPYTGIEVCKVDSNTGERLSGATIKIEEISTGITYTKVTDSNGIAMFSGLRPNDYAVFEIISPTGYKLNPTVFPVSLESNKLSSVTIPDDRLGGLIIKKVDPEGGPIAGAVFEIRTGGGTVITRETTSENGIIFRGNLPTDTYVVEEIQAAPSYLMDENNPQSIYIDNANPNKEYTLTFVNQRRPSIEILKVDAKDPSKVLFGATFRITDSATGNFWDITTNMNGKARLENLTPGITYTCQEIISPDNYLRDDTIFPIVLEPNKTHTITISNEKKPSLEILKVSSEDSNKVLQGATFRITDSTTGNFWDITSGADGIARLDGLDANKTYQCVEIIPPVNFVLNPTIFPIVLEAGKTHKITVENKPVSKLIILKKDKTTGLPLDSTTFRITYNNGSSYQDVTTDSDGKAILSLPEGWITILEIVSKDGWILNEQPIQKYIRDGEETTIEIANDKEPFAKIIKKCSKTGTTLPDAYFKIWQKLPSGDKYLGEFISDENGEILVKLPVGSFKIQESKAPLGFEIDTEIKEFTTEPNKTTEIHFTNTPKNPIFIQKVDTDGKALAGAVFRVTTVSGEFIAEVKSNRQGYAIVPVDAGNFYIVSEILAPSGHILSADPIVIEAKLGEVATVEFVNEKMPGFTLLKLSAEDNQPIPNTRYKITTTSGELIGEYETDHTGTVHLETIPNNTQAIVVTEIRAADGFLIDKKPHTVQLSPDGHATITLYNRKTPSLEILKLDELTRKPIKDTVFVVETLTGESLREYTTDHSGRIRINDISKNTTALVVKEIRANNDYILNEKPVIVPLDKDQSEYSITIYNQKKPQFLLTKRDADSKEVIMGARFKITSLTGELIGEFTSDSSGRVFLDNLPDGVTTLLVKEIKAADGYILSNETHTVLLKENACVELEIFNKSKPGLQIRKIDSVSLLPVSDCVFNIQKLDGGSKTNLGNYTSGENGLIYVPNLDEGYLEITEIKAKDGYKLDPTPVTIFIESGKLNTVEFKNQPYGEIVIKKTSDGEDSIPLKDAVFRVYDERRVEIGTYTTSELGEIVIKDLLEPIIYIQEIKAPSNFVLDSTVRKVDVIPGKIVTVNIKNSEMGSLRILKRDSVSGEPIPNTTFLIYDSKNNIIGEFVSDQHGVVTLPNNLVPQKIKIKEIKSASGYVLNKQDYYVNIKSGETTEIIIENVPERGRIQITKVADGANSITKDKDGAALSGAKFEIYNNKMELVDTIETAKNGLATSKDLPLGVYGIKEVKSPQYYFTNGEMFYGEIKIHEDLIKFRVKNTPVELKTTIEKRGNVEAKAGESIFYDFSNITNSSNVELDEFYWHDKLPTEAVRLEKIWTGVWNDRVKLSVQIKTNLKPNYRTIKTDLLSTVNNEIDCSMLGLAANEYVTDFKIVFGTVKVGFKETTNPKIQVKVLDTVPNQYKFTNKTDVGGRYEKEWVYEIDGWITIVFNVPKGPLPKTGYGTVAGENTVKSKKRVSK